MTRTAPLTRATILALLLTLAAGAATTAPATAAERCPTGSKYTGDIVKRTTRGGVTRTEVLDCSASYRRAVLGRRGGTILLAAHITPDRLAWVIASVRGGRTRVTAVALSQNTDRIFGRVTLLSRRGRHIPASAKVRVSPRGDLAAMVRTGSGHRLVAKRVGAPARVLERGDEVSRLALEDDRTFSWATPGALHAFDLPVPATPGACPPRTGFTEVARSPQIIVTERRYESEIDGPYGTAVRACTVADGTDRLVAGVTFGIGGTVLATVGADRSWVVLRSFFSDQYDGCSDVKVIVAPAGGGASRTWPAPGCGATPVPGEPVAVTDARQVAWVEQRPDGQRVLATSPKGAPRELSPKGASPVTGLRVQGETVFWTRDGVERSAAL